MTFRSEYRRWQDDINRVRQPLWDRLVEALADFWAWVVGY